MKDFLRSLNWMNNDITLRIFDKWELNTEEKKYYQKIWMNLKK